MRHLGVVSLVYFLVSSPSALSWSCLESYKGPVMSLETVTAESDFSLFSLEELAVLNPDILEEKQKNKYLKAVKKREQQWDSAFKKEKKRLEKNRNKIHAKEKERFAICKEREQPRLIRNHRTAVAYFSTIVYTSEFRAGPQATGGRIKLRHPLGTGRGGFTDVLSVMLRSIGNKQTQVYVQDFYNGLNIFSYRGARFPGGREAEFNHIGTDSRSNGHASFWNETYGVTLDNEDLAEYFESGANIRFQAWAQNGVTTVIDVPNDYIFGYIHKVNDAFNIVAITDKQKEIMNDKASKYMSERHKLGLDSSFVFDEKGYLIKMTLARLGWDRK